MIINSRNHRSQITVLCLRNVSKLLRRHGVFNGLRFENGAKKKQTNKQMLHALKFESGPIWIPQVYSSYLDFYCLEQDTGNPTTPKGASASSTQ